MSYRCGRGQRVLQIGGSFICFTGLPAPGQHVSEGLHFWNDHHTMNPSFPNSAFISLHGALALDGGG